MNDKARHHILSAFLIILLILCVVSPFYNFPVKPATSLDPSPDDEPYHYWHSPPNSFGIKEMKMVNWSYFQNWSTDNLFVTLYYRDGGDWIDCSEYLNT